MKRNVSNPVYLFIWIGILLLAGSCSQNKTENNTQQVTGFGFFSRIPGLWNGPVSSSTTAGSFDAWYIDFRPISADQVSQFSMLDTSTVNNISFFIVKYNSQLRIAMRTEGCHQDTCCVTYEVMDSVAEQEGFYSFSDFVKGRKRAVTTFRFTGDRLVVTTYTNKFNTSDTLVWHSTWNAKLGTRSNTLEAATHFNYPQPVMTRDFTSAFNSMTESIFFNFDNDPYNSLSQPYVGSVTVNMSVAANLPVNSSDEIFLVFTTEPLFQGLLYQPQNLKYISRYVLLNAGTKSYKLKNVHPGKYYLYSLIDKNHDGTYMTGDYMSSDIMNTFTLGDSQNISVNTIIDFIIP
ncbi:MAG: hypothetical protein NTU98_02835 [Bacteroidetes bacterium]|nr:hypothetical protein [Bacteroidota bacterium]